MEKIIYLPQHKVLSGGEIACLPNNDRQIIAQQVSQLLSLHQEHMLQFSPQELLGQYINTGNAVAIWDTILKQVVGFAKNHLWPDTNENGQLVREFGSWIVVPEFLKHGLGSKLAIAASKSAQEIDPSGQLVALCATDNYKAITLLYKLGAQEIQRPNNVPSILPIGEITLDLTNINHK